MSARMHLPLGALVWTLLTLGAAAQSPSLTSSTAGRVSGRVASTYAALVPDARITLTRIAPTSAASDPQTALSDPQGRFSFDRVAAGRYRLSASKPGYTDRRLVSPTGATSRASRGPINGHRFETGVEITVSEGRHASGVEIRLQRAASIAGRVAEPDGIPAPDVQVFAAIRDGTRHALLSDTRTISAWDGRYELTDLPPGDYLVVVQPIPSLDPARALANAERRAPEAPVSTRPSFDPTLYPGVPQTERGETVRLLEGIAAEGIDVWLTPAQRFTVSGRVFWPDGLAVDNIAIEYSDVQANRSGIWTVSDPGGLFTITGVPAGTLILLARADSAQGPLAGVASTQVNVSDVEDIRLTLVTPGTVQGRVVYEGGVAVSARPTAIRLAQTLFDVSPLYPAPESAIDSDGRFLMTNALGEYEFVLPDLPPGLRITRVTRNGRDVAGGRIGVGAAETIEGIEVTVSK